MLPIWVLVARQCIYTPKTLNLQLSNSPLAFFSKLHICNGFSICQFSQVAPSILSSGEEKAIEELLWFRVFLFSFFSVQL